MFADGAGRGQPDLAAVARAGQVLECPPQVAQPVGLAHDVGMKRKAHDERLSAGLFAHLLEIVDNHLREGAGVHAARDDGRDVVEFLRIGHRPQHASVAGAHGQRLVVVAPVEGVAVAGLGQQIGCEAALRDPRREPAAWRRSRFACDAIAAARQQAPFGLGRPVALAFGVGVAVADDLVAACGAGGQQIGAMVVEGGVDQRRTGQRELVEQLDAAPRAHAVAVFAPRVVEHVGLGRDRADGRAQPLAEGEVFEIEAQVDRQARAVGPGVVGAAVDGLVVETPVRGQQAFVGRGHAASGGVVPAWRSSSHSALSFHTSMWVIRPWLTT